MSEWGRLEGKRIDERNFLLIFFTSSIELLVRIWWIWRGYRKSLMNATEMFRSLAYALVSKLTLSLTWLVLFLVLKVLLMKEAFSRSISLCLVIFFFFLLLRLSALCFVFVFVGLFQSWDFLLISAMRKDKLIFLLLRGFCWIFADWLDFYHLLLLHLH